MINEIIPVFYACDDNFVKYTIVSLHSMIANASRDRRYHVYILHTGITDGMMQETKKLENENFEISFEDVTSYLQSISDKLPIRDYYSRTTYYRLFIAEMYPEYQKAIYIDSDTVVQGDISKLYDTEIGDAYVGACHEQAMVQVDEYGTYVEKVLGISRYQYYNAGILLINCERFRKSRVLDRFVSLLHTYNFVVTQDEDYLNVICKDHVYWLDQRWNTEIFGEIPYPIDEAYILHYIMTSKPWHYSDCRHGDVFWRYAEKTSVYGEICEVLASYTDAERERDYASCDALLALAIKETNREDHYMNRVNRDQRDPERVAIVRKIEEYERAGRFGEDVEDDPPGRVLMPDEIEYIRKSPADRLKSKAAYAAARTFVGELLRSKKMIVKEIRGVEHLKALESGAIITSNHFNAFESFALQMAYEKAKISHREFYRVIREGNYTSFTGFYGTLMRHCNTLPLSSNLQTMAKFTAAVQELLAEGHLILVYPEQSMWWNYRKPKPLKVGAYTMAAKNRVPVLPCFITMRDSEIVGEDGFPVQEYTVHISEPIYPDPNLSYRENQANMMAKNAEVWKQIYESFYQMPLIYDTVCPMQ
ncbi:MAG: 1-acyl-sn-glycerol-3-phosphate acyltransferase [Clostridia bacterium]|nr:1-acyl-sn-glycerol-3-phosphate acyltransferase [Clostridia bacterium]